MTTKAGQISKFVVDGGEVRAKMRVSESSLNINGVVLDGEKTKMFELNLDKEGLGSLYAYYSRTGTEVVINIGAIDLSGLSKDLAGNPGLAGYKKLRPILDSVADYLFKHDDMGEGVITGGVVTDLSKTLADSELKRAGLLHTLRRNLSAKP